MSYRRWSKGLQNVVYSRHLEPVDMPLTIVYIILLLYAWDSGVNLNSSSFKKMPGHANQLHERFFNRPPVPPK